MTLRAIIILAASTTAAISCGEKNPGPGPTPMPTPPTISCPANMELFVHQGQPQPTANFDTPVPNGGQAPVNVTCNPGSGTVFQNGTTTVRCEAVDALAQKGSCTFNVIVAPVPRLEKTKFMAFGDSITEGKVTLTSRTVVVVPPNIFNEAASYVNRLNSKFEARYLDQTITIIADGYGGEKAGDGKLRLERDWPVYNPDALLVMEGVNDLLSPETGTPEAMNAAMNSVIDALRRMIRYAKGRGARVVVGTLPPMKSPKPENVIAAVPMLNSRIRALVSEENAILADHYAAVPLDLVGSDGLHLKADGYRAMADEWLKQIIATMEVRTSIAH